MRESGCSRLREFGCSSTEAEMTVRLVPETTGSSFLVTHFTQRHTSSPARALRALAAGLFASAISSCTTEPTALTATYSLASVDSRPVPTDLQDSFYLSGPALTRIVNRRLDFRRPD